MKLAEERLEDILRHEVLMQKYRVRVRRARARRLRSERRAVSNQATASLLWGTQRERQGGERCSGWHLV